MEKRETDIEADTKAVANLGESVASVVPIVIGEWHCGANFALALELAQRSAAFPAAVASRWMPGLFPEQQS
jgi:hypothetical protein